MPLRRLALWMRKPLKNALGDLVDIETWGLHLRLSTRDNLSEQRLLFMPRHLDPRERAILATELKDGGVFFDIGANAGTYSLWLASRRIADLHIEAFEPDPLLCERFKWNMIENRLGSVFLNEFALGANEGELRLARVEENLGQNHLISGGDGLVVRVKTLAGVLEEKRLDRIDALKIDVEGHEAEVLHPLFADVEKELWPQLVICEALRREGKREGAKVLLDAGYQFCEATRMNGIFRLPAHFAAFKNQTK